MNSEQNDLEKLLKDNLSDKTAGVPAIVWEKIAAEIYPKKKRRGFFWLFFGGIGLLTGIATACIVFCGERSSAQQIINHKAIALHPVKPAKAVAEQPTAQEHPAPSTSDHRSYRSSEKAAVHNDFVKQPAGTQHWLAAAGISERHPNPGETRVAQRTEPVTNEPSPEEQPAAIPEIVPADVATDPEASAAEPAQPDTLASAAPDTIPAVVTVTESVTTTPPDKPHAADKKWSVGIYGGQSLYDMAVFKDYFTSGQLSNRTFKSGGFEAGLQFGYAITSRISVYGGVAFNRKTSSFRYDLAITESDYFNVVLPGELLPLEQISYNGADNCFLAENVTASYQIDSWLLSLGGTFDLVKWKKFSVGIDLRISANLYSGLKMQELTVIRIDDYAAERFNYVKPGAGLRIDYRLSPWISVGTAPLYNLQLNRDNRSFYAGNLREIVVPLQLKFYF